MFSKLLQMVPKLLHTNNYILHQSFLRELGLSLLLYSAASFFILSGILLRSPNHPANFLSSYLEFHHLLVNFISSYYTRHSNRLSMLSRPFSSISGQSLPFHRDILLIPSSRMGGSVIFLDFKFLYLFSRNYLLFIHSNFRSACPS